MNKEERREYQRKYRKKYVYKEEMAKRLKKLDKEVKLKRFAEIDRDILDVIKERKEKRILSMNKARLKRRNELQKDIYHELEADIKKGISI
ncbi:hypothetical protein BFS35_002295 [Macrococcoides goetzii]|uniref:Uncharacterized protein n=1 Tax=Macrococcoides goetzii TaxID=1891097 RepID=A0A2G5NSU7_9STAP|nr:hypothetical protein [Macrococcus goetzii]RAI82539.1 hypothetical protein BFS35_002295 [Macrococcus goetzii]